MAPEEELDKTERFVVPGDRLYPISETLQAGLGTYELYGHIYASLAGTLYLYTKADDKKKIVEVRRKSESGKQHVIPYIGSVVTAKVLNIGTKFAKCGIVCVENSILAHEFSGILRKENVTTVAKDAADLQKCVCPGDIILARVIGFGDNQRSYLLSTAENELGVVCSVGDMGERMVPCSFSEVKSTITGECEPRKIARIPDLNT